MVEQQDQAEKFVVPDEELARVHKRVAPASSVSFQIDSDTYLDSEKGPYDDFFTCQVCLYVVHEPT